MNLNVIIGVLTGCTLIIFYAYHDIMILCLHYCIVGFFEVLKFCESLIFRFIAILFSQTIPLYGSRGLIPMLGMHAAI